MEEFDEIKSMPFDKSIEAAFLGSLLIDPSLSNKIEISEEDFYIVRHGWIYAAIRDTTNPDIVLVSEKLESRGQLKEIGGGAYLLELINSTPSSLHADEYARRIRHYAKRRNALRLASEIAQCAYDEENFEDKFSVLGARFYELNKVDFGGARHISSALSELYDLIAAASEDPKEIWGMESGFRNWDKILGGHHLQEMLLITGEPSIGKSVWTMDLAVGLAKNGYPGAIFEMEMPDRQLLYRKISGETGIEANRMKSGRIEADEWSLITNTIAEMSELPIYLTDRSSWTISGMRAELMRLKERHNIQWVLVDYLSYITDHQKEVEHVRLGENARSLKIMSRELNLHFMVINSMTKIGEDSAEAKTSDLRGSAQIGFDADMSIFLKRDKVVQKDERGRVINKVNVTFSKFREGDKNRIVELIMQPGIPSFKEVVRLP